MRTANSPKTSISTRFRVIIRKKRTWVVFTILSVSLVGGVVNALIEAPLQEIACQDISSAIATKIEEGQTMTPDRVNDTISDLIRISLISGKIDREGNPTDHMGNAFHVSIVEGAVTTSTTRTILQPFKKHATSQVGG